MRWPFRLILLSAFLWMGANAQVDTVRVAEGYIAQSRELSKSGQVEEGKVSVQRAIDLLSHSTKLTELGFAYWEMAGFYDLSTAQFASKVRYIELSVDAFHRAGNVKKEADALKELADVRQINGNDQEALVELKRALALYQSIGEKTLQGVYDVLASGSCDVGNLHDAISYGLLAERTANELKDTTMQLCAIYNHLGMSYYYQKDLEHSSAYYTRALAVAEKYHSTGDIYTISYNYGNNLIQLGKREECNRLLSGILARYPGIDTMQLVYYTCSFLQNSIALKQYPEAARYFEDLNRICARFPLNIETQSTVYSTSIRYLLATSQNERARRMLAEEDRFIVGNGYSITLVNHYLSLIDLDSATGDYRAAFRDFRKYTRLKDSIYSKERTRHIAQLNVQYETDKKDRDILLKAKDIELLQQKSIGQSAELRRANQVRNWAIAAGILLMLVVGLFVRIVQIKQRGNIRLRRQQGEIEEKNSRLAQLVEEKDWLVKEIHHRVKNNFHMVIALLGTQSKYLRTEEAIRAITDSQNRVYAMALVHQKLYQSETLSSVMMSEYVRDLVHYFRESLGGERAIELRTDIDPVELSLAYCIPLGLIINEAITNSIKYAFPDGQQGVITIRFKRAADDMLVLTIADNGIGLPEGGMLRRSDSMGMKLMNGLSEDLDGGLSITGYPGMEVRVVFRAETAERVYFDNTTFN